MHIKKHGGSFLAIFFFIFPLMARAAPVSLAEWTFPNNPDNNVVDTATPENSTEILTVVGTNAATFTSDGASTSAAQATGWQEGVGSKFWHAKVNTVGYKDVFVSVKLRSSNTGPKDFLLQYRLSPDEAWLDIIGGAFSVGNNFTTGILDLVPLPENTNNAEAVYLRLIMNSSTSVNGGTVAGTGTNRIDDFIITASPVTEPEEDPDPGDQCTGSPEQVRLTEIFPYPSLSDQEYAELFNDGDQCVNISGWRLEDAGHHTYIYPLGSSIAPGEYQALVQNLFLNNTTPDSLTLYSAENEVVSQASYEKAIKGLSLSVEGLSWRFTSYVTPGAENIFDELDEETPALPGNGIIVNEIFPNPTTDESGNEFIELKNITSEEKNLAGWSLVDASQKIFTFPQQTLVPPFGFLVAPRTVFGFALNNTGRESITLLDATGNTLGIAEYSSAEEDFSYSWNGEEWRWTKKVTPGSENVFSKTPKISLLSSDSGYVDIPLTFRLGIKNSKGSYTYAWDFGDGRRSSLKEPRHTYEKKGTYKVSVTLRGENGVTQKEFEISIKNYPRYPVYITALHPNPKGSDQGKEWVEIKNGSNKKIDLSNWSIATGTDELRNHPFTTSLVLLPHQSLRLTRTHASFTLPNTHGLVELRYPNQKTASRTEYQEEVPDDSTCSVINGRCNFSKTEKNTSEENEKSAEETPAEGEQMILGDSVSEPPILPTKKEILMRIGNDFNLLMNAVFLESF